MPWTMNESKRGRRHSGMSIIVSVFVFAIVFGFCVLLWIKLVGG